VSSSESDAGRHIIIRKFLDSISTNFRYWYADRKSRLTYTGLFYIYIYLTAIVLLPGGSVYKRTYIQQGNSTYISRNHTVQHKLPAQGITCFGWILVGVYIYMVSVLTWMKGEGCPERRSSGGRQHPVLQTAGWRSSVWGAAACYQWVLQHQWHSYRQTLWWPSLVRVLSQTLSLGIPL
jgi:hypothetical protein